MALPKLTSLDRQVIEDVLKMGSGYVLDFSDRTFSEFFGDFGVAIDDDAYRTNGGSKANRLRVFMREAEPQLLGRVLDALLKHRLRSDTSVSEDDLQHYRDVVGRLGGAEQREMPPGNLANEPEDELLRRAFDPQRILKLPIEAALAKALMGRLEEAHRCVSAEAYLAAVILCGSVLEGMCLGIGLRQPERMNRGYGSFYNKSAPKFHEWSLRQWIEVLGALGDLSPNVERFGQSVRDFRNYVHPSEQIANRFSPDRRTALICFHVVVAAVEDLVRASAKQDDLR